MKSAIYEGMVRHRRFSPLPHAFSYRLFMMFLDLDELPKVFAGRWLWSVGRRNVASFNREDHVGDPAVALDESVRRLIEAETGIKPAGPIRLLTHLRYFGYVFNPVSFYFCYDEGDRHVEHIVAEITNTPWGERHCMCWGGEALGLAAGAHATGWRRPSTSRPSWTWTSYTTGGLPSRPLSSPSTWKASGRGSAASMRR